MAISNPIDIGSTSAGTALTTTGAVPAGGKVWFVISWFLLTSSLTSVSDGGSTVITIDKQILNGANGLALCSADYPAGLASGATITPTISGGTPADLQIAAMYSTGVQTNAAAAYGAVSATANSATVWNSTNITVANGDILIGGSKWEDSTPASSTPSGGNTEVHDFNGGGGFASTTVYQIGTGAGIAGSGTWSLTSGATSGITAVAVAYKAALAGGGPPSSFTGLPRVQMFMAPGSPYLSFGTAGFPPVAGLAPHEAIYLQAVNRSSTT